MIKNNKVLAVITARGGSKSIPLKNLYKLNKKPLISYNIDVAKKSFGKSIDYLICSTDNKKIKNYCLSKKIKVHDRSKKNSKDKSKSADVLYEVLNDFKKQFNFYPEFIILFQPTSPFILTDHIEKILTKLKNNKKLQTVQTISTFSHNFHAFNQRIFKNNRVKWAFKKQRILAHNKQLKPKYYKFGNLVAIRSMHILNKGDCFGNISSGIVIPRVYSYDLDTYDDISYGEYLINSKKIKFS